MRRIIAISFVALFASCQPTLVAEFQDKAVVESYVHDGSSPTIKISKLIPLRDDVSFSDADINNLNVTVADVTDGVLYSFEPQGEGVYASAEMIAREGHTYQLTIPYNGVSVNATTVIPPPPTGMALSATFISVFARPDMSSVTRADNHGIEVTWDNTDNSYYLLSVECIEENPVEIYETDDEAPARIFRKEPTQGSSAQISQQDFSYFGKHNVILMRIQPEYALLYQTTSETVAEIHANVENGYGIFTGVNSQTLRITVRESSGF